MVHIFCVWIYICFSIFVKKIIELPLHFCQKSLNHICVRMFLASLFHGSLCVSFSQYCAVLITVAS